MDVVVGVVGVVGGGGSSDACFSVESQREDKALGGSIFDRKILRSTLNWNTLFFLSRISFSLHILQGMRMIDEKSVLFIMTIVQGHCSCTLFEICGNIGKRFVDWEVNLVYRYLR